MGTVDPATGAVTALGPVTTLQNDLDQLVWIDTAPVGLDVSIPAGAALYDIDTTTGATTLRANVTTLVQRIAWDPVAERLLAVTARETPRRLVELDVTTGTLTPIGDTHTAAELGGNTIDAIFMAPSPTCP
jgi:hypothetical protein